MVALLIACFVVPVFSVENHISVSLDHRVYPVLRNAEIRGIIDTGMNVRPYATSAVLKYLETIADSPLISKAERALAWELYNELSPEMISENTFNSMLKNGSYSTYFDKLNTSAMFGARLNFQFAQSLSDTSLYDSRNGGDFYLQGNMGDIASFHMNIGLSFDHVEPRIFLKNDYSIPTEGKYDTFWDHAGEHILYYGIYNTPELAVSLLDGNLRFRWASIERDWGVGMNNLMLSNSARSFNALELSYNAASWLRYSFITGALGKFSTKGLQPEEYYDEYYFSDDLHDTEYENNYTAHRVEVDLPWNITFGIYESVVYGKRFELGYLNPLSILMYEQNILGDFDNMLAGVDIEWNLPGVMRLYGAAATTEMNEINPSRFLIAPRNILGVQAGVDVDIPLLAFSTATIQYTYLAPFFYTHYPHKEKVITSYEDDGTGTLVPHYETVITKQLSYVNEGENIGYPLRPNSDEILLAIGMQAPKGWDGSLTVKYQRRSGQYGFNIDKYMRYAAAYANAYEDKDFDGNIFEKTLGIVATINKTLEDMPLRISASYLFSMTTQRTNPPVPVEVWDEDSKSVVPASDPVDYDQTPVIKYQVSGPWDPWTFSHALQLGVNIWF